jgi:hypothetical protein
MRLPYDARRLHERFAHSSKIDEAVEEEDELRSAGGSVAGSVFDDRASAASLVGHNDDRDDAGSVRYIREHVGRTQTCVDVAVPRGVRPGESFSFPLHGVSLAVKCPNGCGEGSKIRVPIPDISSIVLSTLEAAPVGSRIATQLEVLRANVRVALEPLEDVVRRREKDVMPVVRRDANVVIADAAAAAPVVIENDGGVESAMRKTSEMLAWRAFSMGANAIIGVRYVVQQLGAGTELLVAAYGTACILEATEEEEEELGGELAPLDDDEDDDEDGRRRR